MPGASGKPSFADRLRSAFLKPASPSAGVVAEVQPPRSPEELEAAAKSADDKERLIGLLAAPFAAAIGLLVTAALISHNPPARLADGLPNKLHANVSIYHDLTIVLLVLALGMLVTAWYRKRLYLAIIMFLYGLTIFNLHYWGFGVPFIMVGAWLSVRAYRLQKEAREAAGGRGRSQAVGVRPGGNKRYTPRSSRSRPAS